MKSLQTFLMGTMFALLVLAVGYIAFQALTGKTPQQAFVPAAVYLEQSQSMEVPQPAYTITSPQLPTRGPGLDLAATASAGSTMSAATAMAQVAEVQAAWEAVPTLQVFETFTVCMNGIFVYEQPDFSTEPIGALTVGDVWNIVGSDGNQWMAIGVDEKIPMWIPYVAWANCASQ